MKLPLETLTEMYYMVRKGKETVELSISDTCGIGSGPKTCFHDPLSRKGEKV
jgi:hypothetical protein